MLATKKNTKRIGLLEDYFDSLKAREYEKIDKENVDWHSFKQLKEISNH